MGVGSGREGKGAGRGVAPLLDFIHSTDTDKVKGRLEMVLFFGFPLPWNFSANALDYAMPSHPMLQDKNENENENKNNNTVKLYAPINANLSFC